MTRPWTTTDNACLPRAMALGATLSEVAEAIGRHPHTISRYAKRLNLPTKPGNPHRTREQRRQILAAVAAVWAEAGQAGAAARRPAVDRPLPTKEPTLREINARRQAAWMQSKRGNKEPTP